MHELRHPALATAGAASCPECLSLEWEWHQVQPTGTLLSYAVYHRAFDPAFQDEIPYTVGYVQLDDGPRMVRHRARRGRRPRHRRSSSGRLRTRDRWGSARALARRSRIGSTENMVIGTNGRRLERSRRRAARNAAVLLNGVKVVDLTRFLAGPSGAMILGDMGADVLKVEQMTGGLHPPQPAVLLQRRQRLLPVDQPQQALDRAQHQVARGLRGADEAHRRGRRAARQPARAPARGAGLELGEARGDQPRRS